LFSGGSGVSDQIFIVSADTIQVYLDGAYRVITTAVFRDPSAWYHIVVSVDTTQATPANRTIVYVNNVQQAGSGTAITQNNNTKINDAVAHYIGRYAASAAEYFNGYMTEIHFIDGQALDPSYFGVVDNLTGVWRPKQVEDMTYGTNGFYLPFSDNTSTTTLGYDQSGNSNNWTLSAGFSVASGANNDSMVDVPTRYGTDTGAGGEVRGNYATLNPLVALSGTRAFSNGNLQVAVTTDNVSTFGNFQIPSSGKWYFEYQITTITAFPMGGLTSENRADVSSSTVVYRSNGDKLIDGTTSAYGATYTTTDIIGVAVDADGGSVTFYKNGSSQGAISYSVAGLFPVFRSNAQPDTFVVNFGQRPWAYAAPSGFKALCTTNLPDPTVVQGDDYFNTVLYTGNDTTQSITGVGFQPDLVWIKNRADTADHRLHDAVRGSSLGLTTNSTAAESDDSSNFTGFTSDGFNLAGISNRYNDSPETFVAWNWKANGAGSSNTAGSIPSTVSANTTAGISIVTYTGNGTAGATVGHGLGVAPRMIFYKLYSTTSSWIVYHASVGATKILVLNSTAAEANSAAFNNTAPSSTVFTLGGTAEGTNDNSMLAYCFAEVEGFSKFGSYTGNGSADGPFVYTGFRPAWIMIKSANSAYDWIVWDTVRNTYNEFTKFLYPNLNIAEAVGSGTADAVSNGFKVRATSVTRNASGGTYIFAAFAENPFKNSLAR
jgi:hypothetical protein